MASVDSSCHMTMIEQTKPRARIVTRHQDDIAARLMSNLDLKTVLKQEKERLHRLHPTPDDIPGCFSLFDDYVSCAVIRSQIKSIYRYGERPQCSPKFEEFKFCMTLKSLHPEERREAWINRRAEWWANKRLDKSSEDVWDIREQHLQSFPRPITEDMLKTMD